MKRLDDINSMIPSQEKDLQSVTSLFISSQKIKKGVVSKDLMISTNKFLVSEETLISPDTKPWKNPKNYPEVRYGDSKQNQGATTGKGQRANSQ